MATRGSKGRDGANFYRDSLDRAAQKVFDAASAEVDLSQEIRLMRTFLAILADDPVENAIVINNVFAILCRAVYIQARAAGSQSDLERDLLAAAESVLDLEAIS